MADWDEVEGKAKEAAGKVTGDEETEAEGEAQAGWGSVKDDAGDAWDEAKDKLDDSRERL